MLKRMNICLLVLAILLGIAGCRSSIHIELNFTAADVETIDVFYYSIPARAEKKIFTEQADIESIIGTLTSIKVKKGSYDTTAGSDTISFRFHLSDGNSFEVIHHNYGAKKGEIMSSYVFDYTTEADVCSLWDDFPYEILAANENEIPHYEE